MSVNVPAIRDRSYGIIAVRYLSTCLNSSNSTLPRSSNTQVLLIHQKTARPASDWVWCFPKGHAEPSDLSPVHTAIRELQEETSICAALRQVIGPSASLDKQANCFIETYRTPGRTVGKEVQYWMALLSSEQAEQELQIQEKEVAGFRWCSWEQATDLIRFEEGKEVVRSARIYIDSESQPGA